MDSRVHLVRADMYAEWLSQTESIQAVTNPTDVLNAFNSEVSRSVVEAVVTFLEKTISSPSTLTTPGQVHWTMQIIGYGLTLPIVAEEPLVNSCVEIYRDWLSALYSPKPCVPPPIVSDPNSYAQLIFEQFTEVFSPSHGSCPVSEGHVSLCYKVLQVAHTLVKESSVRFSLETWHIFLKSLLRVANNILAPPLQPNDSIGGRLHEHVIHVLFESWLRACAESFPTPVYWKTLRELCCCWRHHPSLIRCWNSVLLSLSLRVVTLLYTPSHLSCLSALPMEDQDFKQMVAMLREDALVQCWFRMLHTLGDLVDLCHADRVLAGSPPQSAAEGEGQPGTPAKRLELLPGIFHDAMSGVAQLVFLFLGIDFGPSWLHGTLDSQQPTTPGPPHHSPAAKRKDNKAEKSSMYASKTTTHTRFYVNIPPAVSKLSESTSVVRPEGNTLLHLFGSWLFGACSSAQTPEGVSTSGLVLQSQEGVDFEAGRAEALRALCSIFSAQPCGVPFLPIYRARFYQSLSYGLQYHPETCSGQMVIFIILSSTSLFRKDLQSINIMLPYFLPMLEFILAGEAKFRYEAKTEELRHAAIQILCCLLCHPYHYLNKPLQELPGAAGGGHFASSGSHQVTPTFLSLKERILRLLFVAVRDEQDAKNLHLLLQSLHVIIKDIATYETAASPSNGQHSDINSCDTNPSLISTEEDFSLAALFKRACAAAKTCLQTQKWECNTLVSLAALELISGLAELNIEDIHHSVTRSIVLDICAYIEGLALKEILRHSKILHTCIVAAFKALLDFISFHPYTLSSQSCLKSIMKVVELGISGTFSEDAKGHVVYKGLKEPKPISGRVKEIAEFVFASVMERVGSFPSPSGPAAPSSLITEEDLLARLPADKKEQSRFCYYILDNSLILALLEKGFTEQKDALPTVSAIIRSPSGRHVWTMQLRNHPRSEASPNKHLHKTARPCLDPPPMSIPKPIYQKPWPDMVNQEPLMRVDGSIPTLEDALGEGLGSIHKTVAEIMDQQMQVENSSHVKVHQNRRPFPDPDLSQEPPEPRAEFETARLFLSHLGLIGIEGVQADPQSRLPPLAMLDSTTGSFRDQLLALDSLPTRFCNTVFVFYCKKGTTQAADILGGQDSLNVTPAEFVDFFNGLGWIVDPAHHPGFAGRLHPSPFKEGSGPLQVQIPRRPFPYHATIMTEVAFVIPTLGPYVSGSTSSVPSHDSSEPSTDSLHVDSFGSGKGALLSDVGVVGTLESERTLTCNMSRPKVGVSAGGGEAIETPRPRTTLGDQDCAAMVVWLEDFEDHAHFPLEVMTNLLHSPAHMGTSKGGGRKILPTIFIHKLSSGLYQIAVRMPSGRNEVSAGPLVDGMVVSRRTLSLLVRQTTINICSRFRMESEWHTNISTPFTNRKRKIEEFSNLFARPIEVAEFFSKLFSSEVK